MPAKVMIATPTADRKVYIRYTSSVINLLKNASDIGATFSNPYFTEGALLSHARNALASLMLEADYTHILFIDSDMGFRPSAVRRLLEFDQPFVSSAYPMRKLNLERLVELAAKGLPYSQALSASSDYVGAPAVVTTPHPETGEPSFRLTDGFCPNGEGGDGFGFDSQGGVRANRGGLSLNSALLPIGPTKISASAPRCSKALPATWRKKGPTSARTSPSA